LFLLAAPLAAQDNDGNIARIILFRAQPGHNQELEEGLKKHMAWHGEQNDTWAWSVWSYETGDFTGGYGAGTFGHNWADFDNPDIDEATDVAEAVESVYPHVAPGAEWRFYQALMKVSKPPAEPAAMSEVFSFRLHYGKDGDFMYLIGKFHKAIEETGWPVNYVWYRLMNGGQMPEYVLVIQHDNYASLKGPDKPFAKMLAEAVGQQEAQALLKQWTKVVKSESSSIARSRPDLSYTPEGGM
jgi:hypothetical protein